MMRLIGGTLCGLMIFGAAALADDGDVQSAEAMEPYTQQVKINDDKTIEFKMTPIPGGTFKMGSPTSEVDRREDEGPQVEIVVEPMWMGVYEVTWDEFDQFLKQYHIEKERGAQPIPEDRAADAVSFPTPQYELGIEKLIAMGRSGGFPAADMTQLCAKQYTKWLSIKTGRFYRLPTEAEWEYACRAGTVTTYNFGDDPGQIKDHGWYWDNANDAYHKVGQFKPNAWGLYDMHGNVAEWVIDGYVADHYAKLAGKGPIKAADAIVWPEEEFSRVVRGGSWYHDPPDLRSAARLYSEPKWNEQDPQIPQSIWHHTEAFWVGFRLVRPLQEPDAAAKVKFWEPQDEYMRDQMLKLNDKQIRAVP
ncbi:formylglycine-generating enzyme family protein [Planctomycetales bacterium ZRK34]|nr:formylglycine-generating enzyme family protein [Planctomycetales bacterium ZRK34]